MNYNTIVGVVLIAFSLITLTILIPTQITELSPAVMAMGAASPRIFPQIATWAVLLLSGVLFFTHLPGVRRRWKERWKKGDPAADSPTEADSPTVKEPFIARPKEVGAFFLVVVLYVSLLNVLGHLLATPIAIAVLMAMLGERKWHRLVATPLVTTVLISLFFRVFLNTILPAGMILDL